MARRGIDLVLHCHFNRDKADQLAAQISAETGVRTLVLQGDIGKEEDVITMVGSALQTMEHVHMLVAGAGITKDRVTWKLDLTQWDEVIRVNLTGAFLCCKHVVPDMRSLGWGRVVLISSVVAQVGVPGTAAYAASKAGLFGLTRTLAKEVAGCGITVNCLALGYFEEGMMLRLPQEAQTRVLEGIPSRRLGRGREAGEVVSYLCGEEASYVTGQVIGVNGGLYT